MSTVESLYVFGPLLALVAGAIIAFGVVHYLDVKEN
jgi:hypothetical protein